MRHALFALTCLTLLGGAASATDLSGTQVRELIPRSEAQVRELIPRSGTQVRELIPRPGTQVRELIPST